jgi:general nucleoside transport system permease protein
VTLVIILLSTITLCAPYILAALGGLASERSGIINLALEGKMLTSACVTGLASVAFNSAAWGVLCGVGAAILLSLLHWLLTQKFSLDHIISGMAINALAIGGTNFLNGAFTDKNRTEGIPILPTWRLDLGSVGIYYISIYLVLAFVLPFLTYLYLRNTRAGLRLLAVGSDPEKARLMGVRPLRVRLIALLVTGVFTGLAGALIISNVGRFTDNMTAGRGYIALAALILGGWRPMQTMVACIAFALFDAIQIQLQGTNLFGAKIPSEAWQALPYLVTVIALAGFLGKSRAPMGLGKA